MSDPSTPPPSAKRPNEAEGEGRSALAWGVAILVLGSSAAFTLYTRKSASMFNRIEQAVEREAKRKGPDYKIGGKTKAEWDAIAKNKAKKDDKDDIF